MPSLNAMAENAKNKKTTVPKKAPKKAQPPTSNLSAEFVQDSDVEQDEKLDESSSSSDEESLPENPAVATPRANGKVTAVSIDSTSSANESDSSEESSSKEEQQAVKASAKPLPSKPSTTKVVSFKETAPYKPPTGFEAASLEDEGSSVSQVLSKSSLEGKQIWYITAPASVPVATIKQTSLAEISKGKSVLSHNGNDYGFTQDSSEDITYTKVMVPRASDDSYRAAAKPIDRILHLQQIVHLPSVYDANTTQHTSSNTARPTIPAKKPVRQQPPGLKMRFRPIGFGSGSTGAIGTSSSSNVGSGSESTSDEEMDDAPLPFRRPASLKVEESPTSSGGSDDDSSSESDAEMTEAPSLPLKPVSKTKPGKSVAKESKKVAEPSLKRKHSDGGDLEAKSSSSISEKSPNENVLKRTKKTPTNTLAGSQSASTETPKTTSSKTSRKTASPIPPPTVDRTHIHGSSSQTNTSSKKSTPILPPKSSPMSPPRSSQASNSHSAARATSDHPPQDVLGKESNRPMNGDAKAKERKKEAKQEKGNKVKHLSKPRPEEVVNVDHMTTSFSRPAKDSEHRQDSNEPSRQPQGLPKEKYHLTDGKVEKKKGKKAGMQTTQQSNSSANDYSQSPITPATRSYSAIPLPTSISQR